MKGDLVIPVKTDEEIRLMVEGGQKLARVKEALRAEVKEGVSAKDLDELAETLIGKEGGYPSFKMVPGYFWSICVNVNEGVVHGIPREEIKFKKGDLVSVDVGMYYKGFHTDTAFTLGIGVDKEISKFLEVGQRALSLAIKAAKPGERIYDISLAIEKTLKKEGYSPIKALVGHGIGRKLHEEPQIPCFVGRVKRDETPKIPKSAALAIEVMYSLGSGEVVLGEDKWTITTSDAKISGFFEETVIVAQDGALVLTDLRES